MKIFARVHLTSTSFRYLTHRAYSRMSSLVAETIENNPFVCEWKTKYGLPPFADIKYHHYKPAIAHGCSENIKDVQRIVENPEAPTFENTIVAYDRCGGQLERVLNVFHNLTSSNSPPELQKIEMELSAPLAEHANAITTYPGLFDRIDAVYRSVRIDKSAAALSPEQLRLLDRVHLDFVRGGAKFNGDAKARYKEIMMRLSVLETQFAQNILEDESSYTLELFTDREGDLAGLPQDLIDAARLVAAEKKLADNCCVITLSRSLVEPFLTYSDNRTHRETAWRAWVSRGLMNPDRFNVPVVREILQLRLEQAQLHGHKSFAEYSTADSMAKSPTAVMDLLQRVWIPAKASCAKEQTAIEEYIQRHGIAITKLEPWDWRYYAEKLRVERYDLDASEVKPYFPLDRITEGLFDCANKLFGLRFIRQPDIVSYHEDVVTYEVRETVTVDDVEQDRLVAIFLHDNFSRPHKAGGAWMSEYRSQRRNIDVATMTSTSSLDVVRDGSVVPIIVNNNNFSKAPPGQQTLLSFDDARTLFHEFGHGLHGMLSNVTYGRLAGTSVLRDFVELPSQLFEHWVQEADVLRKHALHTETGEPIPQVLISKIEAAAGFNSGYDTVSYVSSALIDQSLHNMTEVPADFDVVAFERTELKSLGMIDVVGLRHRPVHFAHLFSTSSYAAAYYVYLWAEVLDADAFGAFKEKTSENPEGNVFSPAVAKRLRNCIYSTGNSVEPGAAFRAFRGRDPIIEPMLRKKSLL